VTADTDGGLRAQAAASLEVTLGALADGLNALVDDKRSRPQQLWNAVRPVPILAGQVPLTAGAGTLDVPDRYGPMDGYWWDVRRLSAWGFTAGTVNVYLNDPSGLGELLASFSQAGQYTWSGQVLLSPQDRFVVIASGITGIVSVAGQAIEVSAQALPDYLI